jgi:hypothetical protein
VQPGVVGASNRNGTSPVNSASSEAPLAPTCGARFVTVTVQVAGASRVVGFGVTLTAVARSTRPAASTRRLSCPATVEVASDTVNRTV